MKNNNIMIVISRATAEQIRAAEARARKPYERRAKPENIIKELELYR